MVRHRIQSEREKVTRALSRVDLQTAVVLCAAALLVLIHARYGSRRLFLDVFGPNVAADLRGLYAWGWWFVSQGILGFVIPVGILILAFKCSPREIGLGLGDWRLALIIAAIYVPIVIAGTWVLSDQVSFQQQYPHLQSAARSWRIFVAYELLFLFYWIGWEYLWRGFVLFGTARSFGVNAVFVQAMPFAILHMDKPMPEPLLALVGGVVLGAIVWRCRSFWIAVPIHAFQMLALDLWCSLRIRTGAKGVSATALLEALGG